MPRRHPPLLHQGGGLRGQADDVRKGGRAGDAFYRDRWAHDKVVRSTHGVNCTGVVQLEGLRQGRRDHLGGAADRLPERRPRQARIRATRLPAWRGLLLVHLLPTRIRYPYVRGVLLRCSAGAGAVWRSGPAWASIVQDPEKAGATRAPRQGRAGPLTWDEVVGHRCAAHVYTVKRWGPTAIAGFFPIPAMSPVSYSSGARFRTGAHRRADAFYDWYADSPNASPQMFGDQTDVPESGDWWDAGYLDHVGPNVPLTRTPTRTG